LVIHINSKKVILFLLSLQNIALNAAQAHYENLFTVNPKGNLCILTDSEINLFLNQNDPKKKTEMFEALDKKVKKGFKEFIKTQEEFVQTLNPETGLRASRQKKAFFLSKGDLAIAKKALEKFEETPDEWFPS
jgi:hypothetical protein